MTLTVSEMREVNARWHYGKHKHRSPFDLFWHAGNRSVHLRIASGRRNLAPPQGAKRIGRYDRGSTWNDVKADLLALARGEITMTGPKLKVPDGLTVDEARRISKRFSVRMSQIGGFDANVYWIPARRDIVVRNAQATNVQPPADAILVRRYPYPYPPCLLLNDIGAIVRGAA
jgi:hypothetical protein